VGRETDFPSTPCISSFHAYRSHFYVSLHTYSFHFYVTFRIYRYEKIIFLRTPRAAHCVLQSVAVSYNVLRCAVVCCSVCCSAAETRIGGQDEEREEDFASSSSYAHPHGHSKVSHQHDFLQCFSWLLSHMSVGTRQKHQTKLHHVTITQKGVISVRLPPAFFVAPITYVYRKTKTFRNRHIKIPHLFCKRDALSWRLLHVSTERPIKYVNTIQSHD